MMRKFIGAVVFATTVAAISDAHAVVCPDKPKETTASAAKALAKELYQSVDDAQTGMKERYGSNVFTSGKAVLPTDSGPKNIGNIWGNYLEKAGHPRPEDIRKCASALSRHGLDHQAGYILVLPRADVDDIDHLQGNLKDIMDQ